MKRFLVLFFVFAFSVTAIAQDSSAGPYLACDVISGEGITISKVDVEITNTANNQVTVVPGTMTVRGADLLIFDLAGYAVGKYNFRARVADNTGWWSDWSDPFIAGKPAKRGNVKIVQ